MSRNSGKINRQSNPDYAEKQEQEIPKPKFDISSLTNLSFVVPTEDVTLPTAGKFYKKDSPLHNLETVKIKHMTAKEEDLISSKGKNTEKSMFDSLIDSVLVDKNMNSSMFYEEDKLAILLKIRETGYGKEYNTVVYCEACNKPSKVDFDLSKISIKQPEQEYIYDPEHGHFTFHLKMMDTEATIRKLTPEDRKSIEAEKEKKQSLGVDFNHTISYIKKCIVSLGDVNDYEVLSKVVEFIPALDAKTIVNFEANCMPVTDTTQEVKCSECDATFESEVPFSWALFRSDI